MADTDAIFDRRRYGKDNYVYLLAEGSDAVLVDPGDPVVALGLAAAHGVRPAAIVHTHGHLDHTGGTATLRTRIGARVLGHSADGRWFAPDEDVAGLGEARVGALRLRIHEVPGHTPGSVLVEWRGRLLTGDTLFWAGCGNCRSGGDPATLARSFLGVLPALDGSLEVHPGHDYAEPNLAFALDLDPGNAAGRDRLDAARAAHAAGEEPRAPTLDDERAVNPFLRVGDPVVRRAILARTSVPGARDEDFFVALRGLRDRA
jgi:hydroxyacylglutathione hydrolase